MVNGKSDIVGVHRDQEWLRVLQSMLQVLRRQPRIDGSLSAGSGLSNRETQRASFLLKKHFFARERAACRFERDALTNVIHLGESARSSSVLLYLQIYQDRHLRRLADPASYGWARAGSSGSDEVKVEIPLGRSPLRRRRSTRVKSERRISRSPLPRPFFCRRRA